MNKTPTRSQSHEPNNPQQPAYSSLTDADLWVKISTEPGCVDELDEPAVSGSRI